MRKWIIAAVALILLGAVVCYAASAAMDWEFGRLDTRKIETNTVEVADPFTGIAIDGMAEDIILRPSEDGACRVVCLEDRSLRHTVTVENGTLTVKSVENKKAPMDLGFHNRSLKITVYLPGQAYAALDIENDAGDVEIPSDFTFETINVDADVGTVRCLASAPAVEIDLDSGDVSLEGMSSGSIRLDTDSGDIDVHSVTCDGDVSVSADSGRVSLQDVTCRSLASEICSGDITLTRVIASDAISIQSDTGDVTMDGCDAAALTIRTDSGDVSGSLLSEKIFLTSTDSGEVKVPQTVTGGRCEISTDSGDITISTP